MVVEEPHETTAEFAVQHGAHRPRDCRRVEVFYGAEHAGFLQNAQRVDAHAVARKRTVALPLVFNCIVFGRKVKEFGRTAHDACRGMCFQQWMKLFFSTTNVTKETNLTVWNQWTLAFTERKRILQRRTTCLSRQIGFIRRALAFIVLFSLFVTFVTFVVLQRRL